ncbi:MAG: guanylate kinase [Acidobacteria bacterium]|nr:guanylate kinase [Acidobacteriota bacterium]
MTGNLFIVSAPSGAGKTTLVTELMTRDEWVKESISYTSRAPRNGEVEGEHYHFVAREEFLEMIERGEFLEWAEVHGNLYGTSRSAVEDMLARDIDVVLTIDVQGAAQMRQVFPSAIGVFIFPPSYEALIERLEKRGANSTEDFELRMRNAIDELDQYRDFDYVVINDDLKRATDELAAIVVAERCRFSRRKRYADEILRTFKT